MESPSWIHRLPMSPKSPKFEGCGMETDDAAPGGPSSVRGSPIAGPPSSPMWSNHSIALGGGGQLEGGYADPDNLSAWCVTRNRESFLKKLGLREMVEAVDSAIRATGPCVVGCFPASEETVSRILRKQIAQDCKFSALGPRRSFCIKSPSPLEPLADAREQDLAAQSAAEPSRNSTAGSYLQEDQPTGSAQDECFAAARFERQQATSRPPLQFCSKQESVPSWVLAALSHRSSQSTCTIADVPAGRPGQDRGHKDSVWGARCALRSSFLEWQCRVRLEREARLKLFARRAKSCLSWGLVSWVKRVDDARELERRHAVDMERKVMRRCLDAWRGLVDTRMETLARSKHMLEDTKRADALARCKEERIRLLESKLDGTESELAAVISGGQEEIRALRAQSVADREALKSLQSKMIRDMHDKLRLSRENESLRLEVAAWRVGTLPL